MLAYLGTGSLAATNDTFAIIIVSINKPVYLTPTGLVTCLVCGCVRPFYSQLLTSKSSRKYRLKIHISSFLMLKYPH